MGDSCGKLAFAKELGTKKVFGCSRIAKEPIDPHDFDRIHPLRLLVQSAIDDPHSPTSDFREGFVFL
jgi:hypothetical protein